MSELKPGPPRADVLEAMRRRSMLRHYKDERVSDKLRWMRKTRTAGGVVTNEEGKVLVVSQRGTSWSLPKGHIDFGEDALAAARREIYEESGIRDLELVRELGSYERHKIGVDGGDDRSELKVITMFLFRTSQKELRPVDPENPEARWVERSMVALLLTHRKDQEFFRRVERTLEEWGKAEEQ